MPDLIVKPAKNTSMCNLNKDIFCPPLIFSMNENNPMNINAKNKYEYILGKLTF